MQSCKIDTNQLNNEHKIAKSTRRETGSFYTCFSIADFIVNWAISEKNTSVLEPSFGEGNFLYSAIDRFSRLGEDNPNIYGVELQKNVFEHFATTKSNIKCFNMDFMDFRIGKSINSVIGNPPYVSLKNLSVESKRKVDKLMNSYGIKMPPSGSLWMPFVVHSTEMLNNGGKLGFVLPYEITYVRYAFKLWDYLKFNYGKISIYRIHKDFFPDVDVETIVFLAENKGSTTDTIEYKTFDSISKLFTDESLQKTTIPISDIYSLDKPFERELLSEETKIILETNRNNGNLQPLINDCKFKIGYVCGNKKYFHPSNSIIKDYSISQSNLIPSLINAKEINEQKNVGVDTYSVTSSHKLFYPLKLKKGDKAYLSYGEMNEVHKGYKCSVRSPWYITPNIEVPDVILTVFGDIPRLISNSAEYVVSNSLLSGKITTNSSTTNKELICRWYNSLTLLMIELYVHSLGGGTLVLIPGEMDKIELLSNFPRSKIENVFSALDSCTIKNGVNATYELGDNLVLKDIYKFTNQEIIEIRKSIEYLRSWRLPNMRRRG